MAAEPISVLVPAIVPMGREFDTAHIGFHGSTQVAGLWLNFFASPTSLRSLRIATSVSHVHTAGDSMDVKVRWTDLTPEEVMIALREDHGIRVSHCVVRQLLKKHNYRQRKALRNAR